MTHLTTQELESQLDYLLSSPKDNGTLELIVCRPVKNERKILEIGQLSCELGLVGDCWKTRGDRHTPDGLSNPEKMLNIMNSRVVALLAQEKDRRALAGDQLFFDLDLSTENLPTGTRLAIGSAIIEVTAPPHLGCKKFVARFGLDAMKFVNSPKRKNLRLRGINARVIQAGTVRNGDKVTKL